MICFKPLNKNLPKTYWAVFVPLKREYILRSIYSRNLSSVWQDGDRWWQLTQVSSGLWLSH